MPGQQNSNEQLLFCVTIHHRCINLVHYALGGLGVAKTGSCTLAKKNKKKKKSKTTVLRKQEGTLPIKIHSGS